MRVYLAGPEFAAGYVKKDESDPSIFRGANILQSFYYCDDFTERVLIPQAKRFMLDSGAFTFFTKGEKVNWDDYLVRYADFICRNNVTQFLELDIDRLVGYEKVLRMREDLERMTGKRCIPVWHKERGKDEFIKMCREYDYVAIGGVAKNPDGPKVVEFFPWFIKTAHEHGARIHGLGYTSISKLSEYHFDSVDSTAWVSGNQYGGVYQFTGNTIVKHKKPDGKRMCNAGRLALHNFTEWKKFAEWAETNL